MMFTITEAEHKILACLNEKTNRAAPESQLITGVTPDSVARRAIEGCLIKGFVSKDGDFLSLTALGELQL